MTTEEIFEIESANTDKVILFEEGTFLRAYERSAWKLCQIHPFSPSKRYIKKLDMEMVSVGFPKASLEKWRGLIGEESGAGPGMTVLFLSPVAFDSAAFGEWKKSLPLKERKSPAGAVTGRKAPADGRDGDVLFMLRNSNLAMLAPVECMFFLNELQTMLGDGKDGE